MQHRIATGGESRQSSAVMSTAMSTRIGAGEAIGVIAVKTGTTTVSGEIAAGVEAGAPGRTVIGTRGVTTVTGIAGTTDIAKGTEPQTDLTAIIKGDDILKGWSP